MLGSVYALESDGNEDAGHILADIDKKKVLQETLDGIKSTIR